MSTSPLSTVTVGLGPGHSGAVKPPHRVTQVPEGSHLRLKVPNHDDVVRATRGKLLAIVTERKACDSAAMTSQCLLQ